MSGSATCDCRCRVIPAQSPDAVIPPRLRPVRKMKSVIEEHVSGAVLTLQIRSPIFGVYSVCGPVHYSPVIEELRVGFAVITSGGWTPRRRVLNIWSGRANLIEVGASDCDPASVQHGSLVRARVLSVEDEFTIVGHAVAQRRSDLIGVGHHTIRSPSGVSPSLLALAEVPGTPLNPPPALWGWSDGEDPRESGE